jgi:hypothetical protein
MAIGAVNTYPNIQSVTNLVRSLVQDDMAGATDTLGEGQVFVDDTTLSVTMSNFFNSGLRTLCRKLRTSTGPTLIYDNILVLNVPPLVSPTQGSAAPDPGVQVCLSYVGYFNGLTYNSNCSLPANCLMVERMWERVSGSNDDFRPMSQPPQGLPSRYQNVYNLYWEWRNDAVWMPGSIQTMDFRLRYQGQLVTLYANGINTATTYIPINDCQDALAGLIIKEIGIRQGAAVLPAVLDWANEQISDFLNEQTKRNQGMPYHVIPFGDGDSSDSLN